MKRPKRLKTTVIMASFFLLSCWYAQVVNAQEDPCRHALRDNEKITVIQFPLINRDEIVKGRLLQEDRNGITVAEVDGPRIEVRTYLEENIQQRRIIRYQMTSWEYDIALAEDFLERTWDFQDDADEFVQTLRLLEKARRDIIDHRGPYAEKVQIVEEKIRKAHESKTDWTRLAQERVDLQQWEFQATMEERMATLYEHLETLSRTLEDMNRTWTEEQRQFEASFERFKSGLASRLQDILAQLDFYDDEINDLWDEVRRRRYFYSTPRIYSVPERRDE